jgi:hypothetical protein
MRVILASLTALAVLYVCDKDLNDGKLLEGLEGSCKRFLTVCFTEPPREIPKALTGSFRAPAPIIPNP